MKLPLPLLLLPVLAAPVFAQRQDIELSSGWSFIRQDAGPAATPDAKWTAVTLPHTWNALDGQNGKAADPNQPEGYYRGPGWYVRTLEIPADLGDRRVVLRCEAVSQVADVYLNDAYVGQHRGGFTAFAFDLTPHLRRDGPNVLRIRADNSRFPDVAPLSGDFTVFGGIYRPVHLLILDPVHVSPLDHGSSGVYLTIDSAAPAAAEITALAVVDNVLAGPAEAALEFDIADSTGKVVAKQTAPVSFAANGSTRIKQRLHLDQPHLWQGRRDPYLYSVTVRVTRGGKAVDSVIQPLGVRTVRIDPKLGFLLNGKPYPVYGVNRHQDRIDQGWALTPANQEEDFRIIDELGATAVRLAHYPQSEVVHRIADRSGLLLWQEISLVDRVPSLKEFAATSRQQLTEMILQGYNHPSLSFWGLFNELKAVWANPLSAPPEPLIRELRELASSLDPSRPIVSASWIRDYDILHDTVPHIAFNQYPGWYWGKPEDVGPMIDFLYAKHGNRLIAMSEYGAGASVQHHSEIPLTTPKNTGSPYHPEEWQTTVHEAAWRAFKNDKRLWGTFIWAMFDFASDGRDEGDTPGRNDKGLVTYDRKTRKDAFYLYQANWSEAPMVHLTSRRLVERHVNPIEVKLYSNCSEVELVVNGASVGKQKPDAIQVCRWPNISLKPGENRIEAIGRTANGAEVRDAVVWLLKSE